MNVNLSPEMERKVRERVGKGYQTESAVIEEALASYFGQTP